MASVSAEHDVSPTKRGTDADRRKLLAYREMDRTLDHITRIDFRYPLLHPTNPIELPIQIFQH